MSVLVAEHLSIKLLVVGNLQLDFMFLGRLQALGSSAIGLHIPLSVPIPC